MADLLFDPVPAELAIDFIRRRVPMKREMFEELLPELQATAFTVAGIEQLDVLQEILDTVAEVPGGGDFDKVKKRVKSILLSHIPPPRDAEPALFADFTADELAEHAAKLDNRAKFITRTLTTRAYAHTAHADLMAAGDALPYWQYLTVGDEHVRDTHRALDGIILPKDDPFWQKHFPPWEFGCRCQVVGVPGPEVDEMRAAEAQKPEEERLVLGPRQIERLHNENKLWRVVGGNKMDANLTPPDEKSEGSGWTFDPADLRPDLGELRARYSPAVFATWEKWARATPLDSRVPKGRTVWDWAGGSSRRQRTAKPAKPPKPPKRSKTLAAAMRKAGITATGMADLAQISALRTALKHEAPATIAGKVSKVTNLGGPYAGALAAEWEAIANEWLAYVDPAIVKNLPSIELVITDNARQLNALGSYNKTTATLTLNSRYLKDSAMRRETFFHELTHWLDFHVDPAQRAPLTKLWQQRTKGRTLTRLASGSTGIPDDLADPSGNDYAGRIYPFEASGGEGLEMATTRLQVLAGTDQELLGHWNHVSPRTGDLAWRETFIAALNLLF